MKRLKVLVYGDQDINIMDGSAIWLTSLINILQKDKRIDVTLLLKSKIRRRHILNNIYELNALKIIDPYSLFEEKVFENNIKLSIKDAVDVIELLDNQYNYDIIITRGKNLTDGSLEKGFRKKQIPYITDFDHDKGIIDEETLNFFNKVYKSFPKVFVQTEEMKKLLMQQMNVNGDKFIILLPSIIDVEKKPTFKSKNYSVVYTGKFAKEWKTEVMIETFTQINKRFRHITLNVAGDKFQGELAEQKEEIINRLKSEQGINWIGAVSRKDSLELIENSDLGFAYRSEDIDNDFSVEISTKFLEYGILGKPVLVRRTKQYEKLLGTDYPLFVKDDEDLYDKTIAALENPEIYKKSAERCYQASVDYQISKVAKNVVASLWSFNQEKETILFAGHDFKFLQWYIDYCKERKDIEVLIDKWDGHDVHDVKKSEELLRKADIVFCEWALGNAVWYSNNKLRGQRLYIRLHRQEIETSYPESIRHENVDRFITIVPHLFEEFNRIKKIPRNKMIIIENAIDYHKFSLSKNENIQFNLGIVGILPKLKRFDRALDIFEKLWLKDSRYKLFVKSKLPEELPWLMGRTKEKEYYDAVFSRIENSPWKDNVIFNPHGNDVNKWFKNISFILSTSDIEGSHVSPMEGMCSGTIPIVHNWPGAETAYPKKFIFNTVDEAVSMIMNSEQFDRKEIKNYPMKFDVKDRIEKFNNLIFAE